MLCHICDGGVVLLHWGGGRARRQMQQAADATGKYVAEQPGKSLVIAAASGALLATLAFWMSRRREAC